MLPSLKRKQKLVSFVAGFIFGVTLPSYLWILYNIGLGIWRESNTAIGTILVITLTIPLAVALAARWRVLLRGKGIEAPLRTLMTAWLWATMVSATVLLFTFLSWGILHGWRTDRISSTPIVVLLAILAALNFFMRWLVCGVVSRRWLAATFIAMEEVLIAWVGIATLAAVSLPAVLLLSPDVVWAKLRLGIACLILGCAALSVLLFIVSKRLVPTFILLAALPQSLRARLIQTWSRNRGRTSTILWALGWSVIAHSCWLLLLLASCSKYKEVTSILTGLQVAVFTYFEPISRFVVIDTTVWELGRTWAWESIPAIPTPPLRIEALQGAVSTWWLLPATLGGFAALYAVVRGTPPWNQNWRVTTPPEPRVATQAELDTARHRLFAAVYAGALAGILGGALAGMVEAVWCYKHWLPSSAEYQLFYWAPAWYGLVFSGYGVVLGGLVGFASVAIGRYRRATGVFALCLGLTLASTLIVIGRFRIARDLLDEQPLSMPQIAALMFAALVLLVVVERVGSLALRRFRTHPAAGAAAVFVAWAFLIGGGYGFAKLEESPRPVPAFAPAQEAKGPNIILITVDTLRAQSLPVYNPDAPVKTPAIDAFAHDAVLYRMSQAQSSWTKASFGTIFTGLQPSVHGALTKASVLAAGQTTIAERLSEAGYYTQGFPNNRNLLPFFGFDQGFTRYDFLDPAFHFWGNYSTETLTLYQALRRVELRIRGNRMRPDQDYQPANTVTNRALAWLDEERPAEAPFFLFIHYMDPHDPYFLADRITAYAFSWLGEDPDPSYRELLSQGYHDEVAFTDQHLGRLFDGLRAAGLFDDSLIILTADHGEELQEHGGWSHGQTLYEEQVHVPLIVHYPGGALSGTENNHLARHIDLVPTMLHEAGLPVPPDLPGIPLERDGAHANGETTLSYAETDLAGTKAASVRSATEKLIYAQPGNPRGLPPVAAFALQSDPTEQSNLAEGSGGASLPLTHELANYPGGLPVPPPWK